MSKIDAFKSELNKSYNALLNSNPYVVAWFSCGITSAVACKIALDTYGKEKLFM